MSSLEFSKVEMGNHWCLDAEEIPWADVIQSKNAWGPTQAALGKRRGAIYEFNLFESP